MKLYAMALSGSLHGPRRISDNQGRGWVCLRQCAQRADRFLGRGLFARVIAWSPTE